MSNRDHSPSCAGCGGNVPADPGGSASDIARRTFLVQSALLAAAAALAACGVGGDLTGPSLPSNTTVKVSDYSVLNNVGGIALVNVSSVQLAIVRTGTSNYVALSRICPHQGGIVNPSGGGFLCPVHGAQFNSSGQWIGGQRTSSLHSYTTSFDSTTGMLTIS